MSRSRWRIAIPFVLLGVVTVVIVAIDGRRRARQAAAEERQVDQELAAAIRSGDASAFEDALARRQVEIDALIPNPLWARCNHEAQVPPLTLAAAEGHVEFCAVLIERGAKVDGVKGKNPPIVTAASCGRAAVVELLLQRGADPRLHAPYESRFDPLIAAVHFGHLDVVRLLVDAGVSLESRGAFGTSLLEWAVASDQADVAGYLLADDPEIDPREAPRLVYAAVSSNCVDCLGLLLRSGVDLHSVDGQSQTALHLAARYDRVEAARILLNEGLDPNALATGAMTSLDLAVEFASPELVRLFLDHGAEIQPHTRDGLEHRMDEASRAEVLAILDGAQGER